MRSEPEPEISVVLPSYNRWGLLSRALASVLAQEGVALEVLVIDDASTDGTPDRLAELGDERVRVFRQPARTGVAGARNRGIDEARAPWVSFLDDDDVWAPRCLAEHLRAAHTADAAWVYGGVLVVDGDGLLRQVLRPPDPDQIDRLLLTTNPIGGPSTVSVRTGLVREVGCFDDRLSVLADWDLWIRLAQKAPAASCAAPLVAYSVHAENMHLRDLSDIDGELSYMTAKHHSLLAAAAAKFGDAEFLDWMAQNHRRAGRRLRAARDFMRSGRAFARDGRWLPAAKAAGRALAMLAGQRLLKVWEYRRAQQAPGPPDWLADSWQATLETHGRIHR